MQELWNVVDKLLRDEKLDEKYHAHQLHGYRKGQWEPYPAQLASYLGAKRNRVDSSPGKCGNTLRPFREKQTVNHMTVRNIRS